MSRIAQLRQLLEQIYICHKEHICKEATLKDAHTYCVLHQLSAQQFGPLLEQYIIERFGFAKNNATNCTGDCVKSNENIEIKVSLGGRSYNKFNYVQIRVNHDVSQYLLTAYTLCKDNVDDEGELFVFRVSHTKMLELLLSHGSYAHGTKKVNGPITEESLHDKANTKEYALRTRVGDECWKALLPCRIQEDEL